MKLIAALYLLFAFTGLSAVAEIKKDIVYGRAGGEPLLLDASVPDGPGPFPVAILVHGGGWIHGDKSGSDRPGNPADISPWFHTLSAANFVWFSINYRPAKPASPFPDCFEDVQTAIRWVKIHAAEFKGDPARIALFGHSAGGNLAGLAATNTTDDTRVQAVVLFAPSSDYSPDLPRHPTVFSTLQDLPRCPPGMTQEALAVARYPWPIDHVTAFMPPVLLVQGDADRTVPFPKTLNFLKKLRSAGVSCDFITLKGAPHSLIEGVKIDPGYQPRMIAWLRQTLAAAKLAPPFRPDITVAADGSGDFKSVQAALDSIPRNNRERRVVLLKEGVYREKIHLDAADVTLRGESRHSTRIEFAAGPNDGVVTIDADDCVLENLSVENTQPGNGDRAPAVTGWGDRTVITDCDIFSEGGDTVDLPNPAGRSYLARLDLRGSAGCLCPQGACYLTDSVIYEEKPSSSAILRPNGGASADRKFVLRDCHFDGPDGWHLLAAQDAAAAQVYLLDCRFSRSMAEEAPFPGGRATGRAAYFYDCHHVGGDDAWDADNLAAAPGAPSPQEITAPWTFGGSWDPESYPAPPHDESQATVTIIPLPDRVRIEIGHRLFSEYIFGGTTKPYFYPILAEDGTGLTRDFPMRPTPGEEHDHVNHRSLWFGHGLVNGHDFWADPKQDPQTGIVRQEALLDIRSGRIGRFRTRDRWELRDGSTVCTDERTVGVWAVPGGRMLDFAITLEADHGALTFGDTKDGTMAIRVAEWMVMPHLIRNHPYPGVGHAVTSEGAVDAAAWGRRASWVDYFAPHDGKILGVALFDSPLNPRHPPWWLARTYGLLAANPFGEHDFEHLPDTHAGDFTVRAGDKVTFRYRFYFHDGDTAAAHVAQYYEDYAAE